MKKLILLCSAILAFLTAGAEVPYQQAADRCTDVLLKKFFNARLGKFYATPGDATKDQFIYWQQAHAIDVVVYSYERIKDSDADLAAKYKKYIESWYSHKANNYHKDSNDPTGFSNPFTDDMLWIGLSLMHISDALDDPKYADTARQLYDSYIIPRAWTDDKGTGLPWNSNGDADGNYRNACTNSPGCLLATRLYERYGDQKYLDDALTLYDYVTGALLFTDGRVEDPPLTYTQGTFGEASRRLYHITGDKDKKNTAELVIRYAMTNGRCNRENLLRDEGTSMDQSIFKAVLIPYAVNFVLDEDMNSRYRETVRKRLVNNAEALWSNLDKEGFTTPGIYCAYWWGEPFTDEMGLPSMGAQTSGASLMENVARMDRALDAVEDIMVDTPEATGRVYNLQGMEVDADSTLAPGIYICDGKKMLRR